MAFAPLTFCCLLPLRPRSSPSLRSTLRVLRALSHVYLGPFHPLFPWLRTLVSFAIYLVNFRSSSTSWFARHSLRAAFPTPSLGKSPFHVLARALPCLLHSSPSPKHTASLPRLPPDAKLHCQSQSPAPGLTSSQRLINIWRMNGELGLLYFL